MLKNNLPPIHPGVYIKESLPEAGLNQAELAAILGCSKSYISDIIKGRKGLSIEMCFKLSNVLGSSPEFWSRLQNGYDLKIAQKNSTIIDAIKNVRSALKSFKLKKLRKQHA